MLLNKELKSVLSVSSITIFSRITGLIRDVLVFSFLGASLWSSAFILAFTIPNLFRRLFGEGALTSAFIPLLADVRKKEGDNYAFRFFNMFCTNWFIYLLLLCILGIFIIYSLIPSELFSEKWQLALSLLNILMPYMIFICLTAIVCATLNVFKRFVYATFSPIIFNLTFILFLLIGYKLNFSQINLVNYLCFVVLLGGLFQLIFPCFDLYKIGWKFEFSKFDKRYKEYIKSFNDLFIPGLFAASIIQINILISRFLAYSLDDKSVSLLYASSRIMELPLGVFTIAIVTVFFPSMASSFASNSIESFKHIFKKGMRFILIILLPASLGIFLLAENILVSLFQWREFTLSDAESAVGILMIYALSLPFYSISTFTIKCLHASKDMKTPLRLSLFVLIINVILSLIFMRTHGVYGLAFANLISAIIHTCILSASLKYDLFISFKDALKEIWKPILLGLMSIIIICFLGKILISFVGLDAKLFSLLVLLILIPLSVLTYMVILDKYKIYEIRNLLFKK